MPKIGCSHRDRQGTEGLPWIQRLAVALSGSDSRFPHDSSGFSVVKIEIRYTKVIEAEDKWMKTFGSIPQDCKTSSAPLTHTAISAPFARIICSIQIIFSYIASLDSKLLGRTYQTFGPKLNFACLRALHHSPLLPALDPQLPRKPRLHYSPPSLWLPRFIYFASQQPACLQEGLISLTAAPLLSSSPLCRHSKNLSSFSLPISSQFLTNIPSSSPPSALIHIDFHTRSFLSLVNTDLVNICLVLTDC